MEKQDKKSLLNFSFKKKHISLIIISLIIVFGVLYLLQMNQMAVKGYKIKDLENRAQELQESNKKLRLKIDEAQSLSYIQDRVADMGMVNMDRVDYVSIGVSAVATK